VITPTTAKKTNIMKDQDSSLPVFIPHDFEVEKDELGKPLYRNWGYSRLVSMGGAVPTSECDFCKKSLGFDYVYETLCWGGNHAEGKLLLRHHVNGNYNPEEGSLSFYCCKECMPKITSLVLLQRKELLNHEILDKVLAIMKFIFK